MLLLMLLVISMWVAKFSNWLVFQHANSSNLQNHILRFRFGSYIIEI